MHPMKLVWPLMVVVAFDAEGSEGVSEEGD
jgi:hypothetical protein